MKKVTAYQCDFCKVPKLYLSRSGAKKHEERCWLNPKRKSCATCGNLYCDYSKDEPVWVCKDTLHTPFKQKIDNCSYYTKGDGIFNDYQAGALEVIIE